MIPGFRSKPYIIFLRKKIYYAQFRLPDGSRGSAKCTGQTSTRSAERWCIEYLKSGQITYKDNTTLIEFSQKFFLWDGPWATDKRVRGLRISQHHCHQLTRLLELHIIPHLGKYKLTRIDKFIIKEFRNKLFNQGYSGNTINKILSTLRIILESAEDQSLIQFIPKIEQAASKPKLKGILTIEEVKKLFSIEWQSDPVHCHPSKDQFMGYAGNLLACSTGLRMGELQALTLSDIHLNEGYIFVRRSWDKLFGMNETTKTGKVRNIFIPNTVTVALSTLISLNPEPNNPESLLFFSEKTPGKPAEPRIFTRSLYTAMRSIGISEQERRDRNITFHSWRHWFNSLLINARIPIQKIQSLTGHLTNEMSQHYYHLQMEDMRDVLQVQESIFSS